jgi:hypothetical protein
VKSAAQLAYEKELADQPRYPNGGLRPDWDHLDPVARDWREHLQRRAAGIMEEKT